MSDERVKTGIALADTERCYQAMKAIPLKVYTWLDTVYTPDQIRDRTKLGWIAQDVEKVFPKSVGQNPFCYSHKDVHGSTVNTVIEDCRDLDTDQMYAVMYGTVQKLMVDSERMQSTILGLQQVISTAGFIV